MSYNDKGKWIGKPSSAPDGLYNPLYDKSKKKPPSTSSNYDDKGKWKGMPSAAPDGLYNPLYDKSKYKTPSKSSSSSSNDSLKISDYEIDANFDDHFESLKNKTKNAKKYNPKILKVKGVKLTNKNLPKRPKAPKAPKIKYKTGSVKKKYKDAPYVGKLKKGLK